MVVLLKNKEIIIEVDGLNNITIINSKNRRSKIKIKPSYLGDLLISCPCGTLVPTAIYGDQSAIQVLPGKVVVVK